MVRGVWMGRASREVCAAGLARVLGRARRTRQVPKPGSGGLTGYEGERSSTPDPSPDASLVAGRSSDLRSWTRQIGHSGGLVQGDGVGRG
eukprot:scaffold99507_cov27-Phaeocystis_antarctica.AAC.1